MDADRFDEMTRRLTAAGTRRRLLRDLAGAVLGGVLGQVGWAVPAAAAPGGAGPAAQGGRCARLNQRCGPGNGKDGKDRDARCCRGLACKGGRCRCKNGGKPCGKRCAPKGGCCNDAGCSPQQRCQAGRCVCRAAGAAPCGPLCLPAGTCCSDADCRGGKRCPEPGDVCRCSDEERECEGACIPLSACCRDTDCPDDRECVGGVCRCDGGRIEIGGKCADPCQGGDCGQVCACQATAEGPKICRFLDTSVCDNTLCDRSDQCPGDEFCIQIVCGGVTRGRCVRGC